MKKKYLIFTLIIAIIFISVILFRSPATVDDLFMDYNKQNISVIRMSHERGELHELSEDDRDYFVSLLEEAKFKQKIIPNVQKFEKNAIIYIQFLDSEDTLNFYFEFDRQILAVEGKDKKLQQFLLVDDTKLTEIIKKNANE